MGCGGSKTSSTFVLQTSRETEAAQDTARVKTPSLSSSSGVSSYRHSQTLQPDARDSQELPQNRPGQGSQEPARESEQQLLAEQQRREEAEAEKRRQEQARAEEEERRRQDLTRAQEAARQQQLQTLMLQNEGQASQQKHSGGRSFTPQEIAQHNAEVNWIEWIPHKGKVYDGNGVRSYFPGYMKNRPAMLEARAEQRVAAGAEEEETEFVTFVQHILPYYDPVSWTYDWAVDNPKIWTHHGIVVLRNIGISEEELAKELPPFLLGTITGTSGSVYFDCLRREVAALLEELRALPGDSKSSVLQDYEAQLARWQEKYQHMDPDHSPVSDGTDPNEKSYPLPVDPDSLRLTLLEGESLDFEVPPQGAWRSFELEKIDLGDAHEIFASSLRVNFDTEELLFDIEGEAAWQVLLDNAVRDDLMTPEQEEVQAARDKRTDLNDPERMKKRRQQLCDYFIDVRELPPAVVLPFLQWASVLEAGQAQLDTLCQEA